MSDTATCRSALTALEQQEDAAHRALRQADAGVTRDAMAKLQDRRHAVASYCVGGRADPPPPRTTARDPVSVAAPRPAAPTAGERSLSTLPLLPAQAPAPKRADPPVFITGCDPGGCWASDGTRLPQTGAGVLSPQAPCTVLAGVLRCGSPR